MDDEKNLKKISEKISFLGIENYLISDCDFFFDDEHFYAINENNEIVKYKIEEIAKLKRTGTIVSNRPIWSIKIKQKNNDEINFKFLHNYTLWNKNFKKFYDLLKLKKSEAIQSNWSFWRM